MARVVTGLNWETWLFYFDDIIMFSKVGATKCTLAAQEVNHLGHCVTRDRHLPNPVLLQTICEIAPPQNVKELTQLWVL